MPDYELCLLALDGGGIRGLSSLQILKQLMETIDPDSPPKPCEYFDMIGGTSTGGLLAIMLGRLQMTIDDCIDAYVSLSDRIFQKRRHSVTVKGQVQGRFDSKELERAIKDIIVRQGLDQDASLLDSPNARCKVFVCATSKETGDTVHLASYRSPRNRGLSRTPKIWEAGRATSAASSFFDPIRIGHFGEEFVDGATGANNPVYDLWNEAQDMWPSGSLEDNVKCLISIGTGVPSLRPFGDSLLGIARTLKDIATETEKTVEKFYRDKARLDNEGRYYRFNVQHGLEDIGLEDSSRKNAIVAATSRYVESQAVFKQMKACGNNLADREYFGPYHTQFSLDGIPVVSSFVDRPSEMSQIEDALLPRKQKRQRTIFVLHGLGGIGKTQLSVAFARRNKHRFSSMFWLDGRTEETLKQSIARAASRIQKGQIPEESRNYTNRSDIDLNKVISDVKGWLSRADNCSWLLIFDNVDREYGLSNADDASAYDVRNYFPEADQGSILITTRLANLYQLGKSLRLTRTNDAQARQIFENGYGQNIEDSDESEKLLRLLDRLPLALAQASAYMRQTGTTFSEYVQFYQEQWRELMETSADDGSFLHDYPDRSIWTTWMLSYKAIRNRNEAAANLLLLWAHLDNRDLWFGLLSPVVNTYVQADTPLWYKEIAGNELKFKMMMKLLLGYSMAESSPGGSAYAMHPVVHKWALQLQERKEVIEFGCLALVLVGMAVPEKSEKEYWMIQRRLMPHARCCSPLFQSLAISQCAPVLSDALHKLGDLYADQSKLEEADQMYQRALERQEKVLGPEHTSTLDTVNNLGNLYADQGKLDEAEQMYQRALEGYEKALGLENVNTYIPALHTIENLGTLYADQGKPAKARGMYSRALLGFQTVLGTKHEKPQRPIRALNSLNYSEVATAEGCEDALRDIQVKKRRASKFRRYLCIFLP